MEIQDSREKLLSDTETVIEEAKKEGKINYESMAERLLFGWQDNPQARLNDEEDYSQKDLDPAREFNKRRTAWGSAIYNLLIYPLLEDYEEGLLEIKEEGAHWLKTINEKAKKFLEKWIYVTTQIPQESVEYKNRMDELIKEGDTLITETKDFLRTHVSASQKT